jgi:hypothetical protein
VCTIQSAPIDLLATARERNPELFANGRVPHLDVNPYHPDNAFEGELLETIKAILDALNTGNHDRSDSMTDYFDVGWYVDLNIGRWDRAFEVKS